MEIIKIRDQFFWQIRSIHLRQKFGINFSPINLKNSRCQNSKFNDFFFQRNNFHQLTSPAASKKASRIKNFPEILDRIFGAILVVSYFTFVVVFFCKYLDWKESSFLGKNFWVLEHRHLGKFYSLTHFPNNANSINL